MRESVLETKGRWAVAAGGGIAITVTLLLLLRLPPPISPLSGPLDTSAPKATVQMARPDDTDILLKAEAELRDLRPLFLPTERNAALPEPRLEPGRTFLDIEAPKLMFTDSEAQVSKDLPPVVKLDGKPMETASTVDALSPFEAGFTLQGLGRTEAAITKFTPRAGYLEVTALADGARVLGLELPMEGQPPVGKSWAPVEFIAVADAAGLVSPLVVTSGSRVDEVDSHFRTYLADNFRLGDRLAAGFYRVTVSP